MTKHQFRKANARRCDLINKLFAGGLSQAESVELEGLERECEKWVDERSTLPLESLEKLEALNDAFKAKEAK